MGESTFGYVERKRREAEARATAKRCLSVIDRMDPQEYEQFLVDIYTERGWTCADVLSFRARYFDPQQTQPVPDVDEDEDDILGGIE